MTEQKSGFSAILEDNKKSMDKINEFKNQPVTAKQRNLIFAGILVGTLFLFMMFAVQIIQGVIALIMVIVLAAGSFFGIRFLKAADPLIKQKTKNFVLDKMIQEARQKFQTHLMQGCYALPE